MAQGSRLILVTMEAEAHRLRKLSKGVLTMATLVCVLKYFTKSKSMKV